MKNKYVKEKYGMIVAILFVIQAIVILFSFNTGYSINGMLNPYNYFNVAYGISLTAYLISAIFIFFNLSKPEKLILIIALTLLVTGTSVGISLILYQNELYSQVNLILPPYSIGTAIWSLSYRSILTIGSYVLLLLGIKDEKNRVAFIVVFIILQVIGRYNSLLSIMSISQHNFNAFLTQLFTFGLSLVAPIMSIFIVLNTKDNDSENEMAEKKEDDLYDFDYYDMKH